MKHILSLFSSPWPKLSTIFAQVLLQNLSKLALKEFKQGDRETNPKVKGLIQSLEFQQQRLIFEIPKSIQCKFFRNLLVYSHFNHVLMILWMS